MALSSSKFTSHGLCSWPAGQRMDMGLISLQSELSKQPIFLVQVHCSLLQGALPTISPTFSTLTFLPAAGVFGLFNTWSAALNHYLSFLHMDFHDWQLNRLVPQGKTGFPISLCKNNTWWVQEWPHLCRRHSGHEIQGLQVRQRNSRGTGLEAQADFCSPSKSCFLLVPLRFHTGSYVHWNFLSVPYSPFSFAN